MKSPQWALLFALTCLPVFAQSALSVEQILEEAQKSNLRLLAERYNISIAEARIIQSRLRPNPSGILSVNYIDAFRQIFSPNTNNGGPREVNTGILFPYEWANKRKGRVELAEGARGILEADFLNSLRNLRFNVQSAYVDVLQAKGTYSILTESQQVFERITAINKARLDAGDLAKVEFIRSEVAALQFANQVRQAESRLRQAKLRLQLLMGRTTFDTTFDVTGELSNQPLLDTLEQIMANALRDRPEIEHSRRDLIRSSADIKYQEALKRPDLAITTVYNRQGGYAYANSLGVTLQVPLPIFNKNQGEIERAKRDYAQTQLELRAAENEVRGEVTSAWEQYQTARALLEKIETQMLARAKMVRETIEFSYRRGEATFVEFLDAQRTFNETMQGYLEAKAEYQRTLFLMDSIQAKGVKP